MGIESWQLERIGGNWLGALRSWIQRTFNNGSDVTWGSNDVLKGRALTEKLLVEASAIASAAAINEHVRNNKRLIADLANYALANVGTEELKQNKDKCSWYIDLYEYNKVYNIMPDDWFHVSIDDAKMILMQQHNLFRFSRAFYF